MEQPQNQLTSGRTLYPPSNYYNPSWSAVTHHDGFVVPSCNPLTTDSLVSAFVVPSPSYREVRDVLAANTNYMSRKEKRRLIKNKRKRIQRKEVTLLANSLVKEVRFWKSP